MKVKKNEIQNAQYGYASLFFFLSGAPENCFRQMQTWAFKEKCYKRIGIKTQTSKENFRVFAWL